VRDYNDKSGKPVTQTGLANAQSAVDWARQQQVEGKLAAQLSEVVVMGCSAGSIGAQLWGNQVLKALKWKSAAVIPDSYAGVFPEGTQGPLVADYGFCTASFITDSQRAACNARQLTLQILNDDFMTELPHVPYSFIQSKTDIVQQSFYVSVGISANTTASITPTEFYNDVNAIFGTYNKNHANFLTYLVDGDQHCFTPLAVYPTADAKGASDNGASSSSPMMHSWVEGFPLSKGESTSTICDGTVQQGNGAINDNTYCSTTVVPKSFVEHY